MVDISIWKEKGLVQELKIFAERHIPYYEPIVLPQFIYIKDKIHESTARKALNYIFDQQKLNGTFPCFRHIEIEIVNACNGDCEFCPVNRHIDPRRLNGIVYMTDELFYNIIDQLRDMDYDGEICMCLNNEPYIDSRLEKFLEYTRKNVPKARIIMYTNGKLLTTDRFEDTIHNLDLLIIDNYNNNREFNKTTQTIMQFINAYPEHASKVHINVTRIDAIRNTRAGLAKNRSKIYGIYSPCLHPFWQINIRPDGKVSLCCNDAIGMYTLGDTNTETLLEIWNGNKYNDIRNKMMINRQQIKMCSQCDVFHIEKELLDVLKV